MTWFLSDHCSRFVFAWDAATQKKADERHVSRDRLKQQATKEPRHG